MSEYLRKIFLQIGEFLRTLSLGKKIGLGITALAIFGGMGSVFWWAGDQTYSNLMSNLNPEDAAQIIRVLREKQIPFKVDSTGRNITVPPESVDQLRLELATQGLPQASVVGYEVFDKQSLGTTSFAQKVNQKRALEGELTRTISQIKGVKRARVHLAMPQKSTFVEDQKKSSASVIVDLAPGIVLNEKQIYGIGNLVAKAVEGMDTSDVVIVDSHGKTLSKNVTDSLAQATVTQLEFRQKMETELEARIEAMLARVVGDGRVVAKVSAELDFSQVSETQTTYDADAAAVRSVQRNQASADMARPGPRGPAGAESNLPGGSGANAPPLVKSDTKQTNEVTNYEVPQTVRRVTKPSGTVQRLSVAVVVDAKKVKTTNKDGVSETKTEAWTPEKLKEFEQIVAGAVGLDKKRGDTLEIKNIEFTQEDFVEAQRLIEETERKGFLTQMIIYVVVGLTIAMFFLLVVRPFMKWFTENTVESVESYLPQTIEELERLQKNAQMQALEEAVPVLADKIDPEKVEGEMIKEKIVSLVDNNPHKAALIIRDWLHAGGGSLKKDDKGGGGGKSKSA